MAVDLRENDLVRDRATGNLWLTLRVDYHHPAKPIVYATLAALDGTDTLRAFKVTDAGDAGFVGESLGAHGAH